jgi:hypothetical protein
MGLPELSLGLNVRAFAINWSTHILNAFEKMQDGLKKGDLVIYDDIEVHAGDNHI